MSSYVALPVGGFAYVVVKKDGLQTQYRITARQVQGINRDNKAVIVYDIDVRNPSSHTWRELDTMLTFEDACSYCESGGQEKR